MYYEQRMQAQHTSRYETMDMRKRGKTQKEYQQHGNSTRNQASTVQEQSEAETIESHRRSTRRFYTPDCNLYVCR